MAIVPKLRIRVGINRIYSFRLIRLYLNRLNIKILENFILNLSVYTEVLPVIFYLVFRKKMNDKGLQVVFFLLAVTFIIDLYGLYTISNHKDNFLSYNIHLLVEGICFSIFFYQIFRNRPIRKIIYGTGGFFILYWLYKFIKVGGTDVFLGTCETIKNVLIFAFAIYYYYERVIKTNEISVFSRPAFWVVTAYLIYIAGTFFLLLYLPSLSKPDQEKYYILNYVFVVIRTIVLSVAMFMKSNESGGITHNSEASSTLTKRSFN